MEREYKFALLIISLLAVAGCREGGEGGSAGDPGTPALDPLGTMPRYAVVSSDFSSSSIAMLDESFDPIDESWVNSGTTYPGLVATLSGDVVYEIFGRELSMGKSMGLMGMVAMVQNSAKKAMEAGE